MLTKTVVSVLLMVSGLSGSDLQVYGKSLYSETNLQSSNESRHTARKHTHQQSKNEMLRSLDLTRFNVHVTPSTSKLSLPNIIRLYPPTAKPLHLHANMPMRFGRESLPDDEDKAPNSPPNMPQRFGRAWEMIRMCAECPEVQETPNPTGLRPKSGRSLYWSLLKTLVNEQLLNTDLDWT